MRLMLGLVAALALAGCMKERGGPQVPMGPLEPADPPIPPEVRAALPAGIAHADILVRLPPAPGGPCYFYRAADGSVRPVETAEMRAAGLSGLPYCIM